MGPSADRRQLGAETVRYYPRLPHGRETFAARFGADGKLIAFEQRLTEENVARLKADRSRADDVRDLLGPPFRIARYSLSQLDGRVWAAEPHHLDLPRAAGDGLLQRRRAGLDLGRHLHIQTDGQARIEPGQLVPSRMTVRAVADASAALARGARAPRFTRCSYS